MHYNMKYQSIEDALKQADGLAVLGVFLKVCFQIFKIGLLSEKWFYQETRSDNALIEPIVQLMPRIRFKNQSTPVDRGFDIMKLIPGI